MLRQRATLAWSVLVGSCLGNAVCSGPVAPGSSRTIAAEMSGYVDDTAFKALSNARVEVLDGPQAGTATTTDANGRFSLTGEFTAGTRFRATKDGYQAAVEAAAQSPPLTFFMSVAGPSGNHATLTVESDPACSDLPGDLRTRTYPATVTNARFPLLPANTTFFATLSGAALDSYFHSVLITVAGDQVTFNLSDNGIEEEVAPEAYLFVGGMGYAVTQAGATTISARFSGVVDYCVLRSDPGTLYPCSDQAIKRVQCTSTNHHMTLTWP